MNRRERAIAIAGPETTIAGDEPLPLRHPETGILAGLPGGDPYLPPAIEAGLIAEHRLTMLARVRAYRIGGFARLIDSKSLGLPMPVADVDGARGELRRERARGMGLHLPGKDTE